MTEVRDLALRAVGRNVVNFQKLEMHLKCLARLKPVDGTHAQIRQKLASRSKRLSSTTLGTAIADWLDVLADRPLPPHQPDDLFDATAQLIVSFKASDQEKQRHADALSNLLIERNDLIHKALVAMDWGSSEQCTELVADLDAQNERIIQEIRFARSFITAVRDISELMRSDEFLKRLLDPSNAHEAL